MHRQVMSIKSATTPVTPDWQLGKSGSACMGELFRRNLWTDVRFRCRDQDRGDTEDRLCAHRVVLAARSPVFQAMFFGAYQDQSSEIEMDETDAVCFEMFLLYLYSDSTNLTETTASTVLQIAHKYQVPTLVKYCCDFLIECLTSENACETLQLAMFYEEEDLTRKVAKFIDINAEGVLESDGFLHLPHNCLLYLLKGDTFLVDEALIFDTAMKWATNKCQTDGHVLTSVEQKAILGEVFYYIRIPTMNMLDFSKRTLQSDLYSLDEYKNIVGHIAGNTSNITSNCTKSRVPLVETVVADHQNQHQFIDEMGSICEITANADVLLTGFRIPTMAGATELWRLSTKHQYALSFEGKFSIPEIDYVQSFTTALERVSEEFVMFTKPVLLKKRDHEYSVHVTMKCRVTQSVNAWLANAQKVYVSRSGNLQMKYSAGLMCVEEICFENVSSRYNDGKPK